MLFIGYESVFMIVFFVELSVCDGCSFSFGRRVDFVRLADVWFDESIEQLQRAVKSSVDSL